MRPYWIRHFENTNFDRRFEFAVISNFQKVIVIVNILRSDLDSATRKTL